MQGKAHLIFGTMTGLATAIVFQNQLDTVENISCFVVGTMIGSILPDIDNEESKIAYRFPIISKICYSIFGHRGFIHSLLNVLILFLLITIGNYYNVELTNAIFALFLSIFILKLFKGKRLLKRLILTGITLDIERLILSGISFLPYGILLGMIGHLFCDLFTKQGIKLFYPFGDYIHLTNKKSGSLVEIFAVILFSIGYYALISNYWRFFT